MDTFHVLIDWMCGSRVLEELILKYVKNFGHQIGAIFQILEAKIAILGLSSG